MAYYRAEIRRIYERLEAAESELREKAKSYDGLEPLCTELFQIRSELRIAFLDTEEKRGRKKGTRTERAAAASRANGKKGGRPPKEITDANKRIREILAGNPLSASSELAELEEKVRAWKLSRK